jgi:hypothetical protein
MVFSISFALIPTKAQAIEGEAQWNAQPLPTGLYNKLANGTDVTEYAIASNGTTMYAIGGINLSLANAIYKSLDAGLTWVGMPAIAGAQALPVTNIAVAPDNPDAVAVSAGSNAAANAAVDVVWISNNGGTTWAQLPAPNLSAANMRVRDLDVAQARVGTLFPHEYLIATSDNAAATVTLGTLQIIGQGAAWVTVQAGGTYDFTSCKLSPGYAGDRIAIGVGSTAAITVLATYNTQTPALAHAVVQLSAVITDYAGGVGAGTIFNSDLALPSDYDVTVPGFERVFAATANGTAANDNTWRVDSVLPAVALGPAGTSVRSIAYSGTGISGTLFEGNWAGAGIYTQVNWTPQAQTNLPVWYPSRKPTTGAGGLAFVRVSPNFAEDKTVYVGTSGNESAFALSIDAGDTYNQKSLIDNAAGNTVVAVDAIMLAPDGATLFVVSRASGNINLWKTTTAPAPFSWMRIYTVAGAGPVLIALNMGEWATKPEIYLFNTAIAANGLFASYDGGNIFTTKHLPATTSVFASVAGSKFLYLAIGVNVYKSTNGGQQWGAPINANVGNIATVLPAANGDVLVGGTGIASISKDSGATFAQLQPGLPAAAVGVLPDADYATNNIVYAFDFATAAASDIYRVNVATGAIFEALANPTAGPIVGFGQSNGALYAMVAASADRTLDPKSTAGTITWGTMNIGAPAAIVPGCFSVAANKAYASNGAVAMWAYNDMMATAKSVISSPTDGASIAIDPVNGRAEIVTLAWSALGTGTALGTTYDVLIFESAQGPTEGTFFPAVAIGPPSRTAPKADIGAGLAIAYTFIGGRSYSILVRAANEVSTDAIISAWSAPVSVTIAPSSGVISPHQAGPVLLGPNPGASDVNPGVAFSWTPIAGATSYEFILATDAALATQVVKENVAQPAYGPMTLEYGTDYYYAVRVIAPTSGVQSIGSFTTMSLPVVPTPPGVPAWTWVIIIIGAILVIAVVALIFTTRKTT